MAAVKQHYGKRAGEISREVYFTAVYACEGNVWKHIPRLKFFDHHCSLLFSEFFLTYAKQSPLDALHRVKCSFV